MAADITDPPNPGRRKLMAAGAALAAGAAAPNGANAKIVLKSPPTTPFVVALPVYGTKAPVPSLLPLPGRLPSGQEAGRTAFQRSADFVPQK